MLPLQVHSSGAWQNDYLFRSPMTTPQPDLWLMVLTDQPSEALLRTLSCVPITENGEQEGHCHHPAGQAENHNQETEHRRHHNFWLQMACRC